MKSPSKKQSRAWRIESKIDVSFWHAHVMLNYFPHDNSTNHVETRHDVTMTVQRPLRAW